MKIQRLHIGAKNLIEIPKVSWDVLSHESWIHLGTKKPDLSQPSGNIQQDDKPSYLTKLCKALKSKIEPVKESIPSGKGIDPRDLTIWENSKLIQWHYKKGDLLPFKDQIFTFVYSEHFFEHLFLDEAISLFKEIFRVMTKGAVCRTVVPDADLRIYESPEPVGYPDENMAWDNSEKHKTRWSFNVLDEILKITGFKSRIGLVCCTPEGKFINRDPKEECSHEYSGCIDTEVIFDMSYIARTKSLIVDAIKR